MKYRIVMIMSLALLPFTRIQLQAQSTPDILEFYSGKITWSNVNPSLYYTIEWTPTLNEPSWTGSFRGLQDLHSPEPTISVDVPLNLRVVGSSTPSHTKTLSPDSSIMSAGYYESTDLAAIAPSLTSSNIRAGTSIFGINGNSNVVDTASGNADASDIQLGRTAWVNGVEISGTRNEPSIGPYTQLANFTEYYAKQDQLILSTVKASDFSDDGGFRIGGWIYVNGALMGSSCFYGPNGYSPENTLTIPVRKGDLWRCSGHGVRSLYAVPFLSTANVNTNTSSINIEGDLHFGNVSTDTNSQRKIIIHNDGGKSLIVSSINYPGGFSGNWSNGTINAYNSPVVTVTFSPTSLTTYGGSITVISDADSGTNILNVSGTGIAP